MFTGSKKWVLVCFERLISLNWYSLFSSLDKVNFPLDYYITCEIIQVWQYVKHSQTA